MVDRFGGLGRLLTPLLTLQLRPRLGIGLEALRPIEHAKTLTVPKFFLSGSADHLTTAQEARDLFAAAAAPKEFWLVANAAHVDLHAFARAEYEQRVLGFLGQHLH